jgi:hypothetical protein
MAKAQWRQTGAGPHEDRRTHRNRDRQAQKRHAIEESTGEEKAAARKAVAANSENFYEEHMFNDMLGLMD